MKVKTIVTIVLTLLGVAIGGYFLYATFRQYSAAEVIASVKALPVDQFVLALVYAAASYLCLAVLEGLAISYSGKSLPMGRIGLSSFVSLSIGHSIGLGGLSSGAIRYRYYSRWGLSAEEIAKVVLMCGLSVVVGTVCLTGIVTIFNANDASKALRLRPDEVVAIGAACLAFVAAYLGVAALRSEPVRLWKWHVQFPSLKLSIYQTVLATLNFSLVSACLYHSFGAADATYFKSATAFVLANIAVLVANSPGGLGVLEATVNHVMQTENVVGGLIAFRLAYFLIPLALGVVTGIAAEMTFKAKSYQAE